MQVGHVVDIHEIYLVLQGVFNSLSSATAMHLIIGPMLSAQP